MCVISLYYFFHLKVYSVKMSYTHSHVLSSLNSSPPQSPSVSTPPLYDESDELKNLNEDDEMNLTRLQASPQQSVTESMWDSFTWPPEDSKPESVPGSPVVTSSPRQMKSIIDWMSSASPPSPPPAFVPETAPDLRDWNVLAYHPALVCRKCQHRVEIGWDHNIEVYKTTTYPCNLHKMIPLN